MNVTTTHRPGLGRGWARRVGQTVVALISCVLLAASCSHGSSEPGVADAGSSALDSVPPRHSSRPR
jgi:hypothetical protein